MNYYCENCGGVLEVKEENTYGSAGVGTTLVECPCVAARLEEPDTGAFEDGKEEGYDVGFQDGFDKAYEEQGQVIADQEDELARLQDEISELKSEISNLETELNNREE